MTTFADTLDILDLLAPMRPYYREPEPEPQPAPQGPTTVYRVEHRACGCGPYNPHKGHGSHICPRIGYSWGWMPADEYEGLVDEPVTEADVHPSPDEDGINLYETMKRGMVYGFASLDDARRWFAPYVDLLAADDYVVTAYLVDRSLVVEGGHQCAFLKDAAAAVDTLPTETLSVTHVTV